MYLSDDQITKDVSRVCAVRSPDGWRNLYSGGII